MHDEDQLWFLVVRNHETGTTDVNIFEDPDKAVYSYNEAEAEYRSRTRGRAPELEVVLLMADSFDDLVHGYPHYFNEGSREERQHSILDTHIEKLFWDVKDKRHLADA